MFSSELVAKLHDSGKLMILEAVLRQGETWPGRFDGGLPRRVGEEKRSQQPPKGRFYMSKSFATGSNINWEDQWSLNAPLFKNGRALIPLGNHFFELLPGPGFGDFSHPTTQLMLEIMELYVGGRTVFDIGCGSGILSIAAKKLGAKEVYCCDIDPEALVHTKKNAFHNEVSLLFSHPKNPQIILMNMIESEQKIAWQKQSAPFEYLITSGILIADQERYLSFAKEQGWHLIKKYTKNDWAGFVFSHGDLKNES